ncbi:hypothetical protein [Actinoalloteichus caeruleus]|uniref:Uncharacterized protein n=1 Tax=Actinoalloteichus caeruleus DSM 43889 TaxID=1120930 RepID=A0ABT1JN78_ACTCY|nr:hypothetical protein [Actinoalloteichus caeruleus]MCP2333966.1 hypothetical protein [Actinoalloteichus caeruleus DSM 43889]
MTTPGTVLPGTEIGRILAWWPAGHQTTTLRVEASPLGVILRPEDTPTEPMGIPPVQARRLAGALLVAHAHAVATVLTTGPELVASLMVTSLPGLGGKLLTLACPGLEPRRWALPTTWQPTRPGDPPLTHPEAAGTLLGHAAGHPPIDRTASPLP